MTPPREPSTQPVAIVTGASAGIGRHVAVRLAEQGYAVALAARSESKLSTLTDQLTAAGHPVEAIPTDVGDPTALDALVRRTLSRFGRIDVLINNAGVDLFCPTERILTDDIHNTVQVNLTGAMILTRLVLPTMIEQGSGHIVNMSSTSGLFGAAYGGVYAATKAGLVAFTRSLRAEYASRGLLASVICPGFTNSGGIYERMKRKLGRGTPTLLGETTTEQVGDAVLRTLAKHRPEQICNWPPQRPLTILQSAFPRFTGWLIRKASLRYLKRIATGEEQTTEAPTAKAA